MGGRRVVLIDHSGAGKSSCLGALGLERKSADMDAVLGPSSRRRCLLRWTGSDSRRHAVLADNGLVGILYLHAPSHDRAKIGEVEASCFAYNRVDPIDAKDVQNYRPGPPPIAQGYASKDAVCGKPGLHQWELNFSEDGATVLFRRDGRPWAIASFDAPRGFSMAIQFPGPWGSPWSDEIYNAIKWRRQMPRSRGEGGFQ